MTLQEKKAKAYDLIGQIEYAQACLRNLNQEIAAEQNAATGPVMPETTAKRDEGKQTRTDE